MSTSRPAPARLRIVALPGSVARNSACHSVLCAAQSQAPPGMRIDVFEGMRHVALFDRGGDAPDGPPEGVRRLRSAVEAADGLLIATPEHNQSAPALLMNAIEWLSLGHGAGQLVGMPVALVGVEGVATGTRLAQRTLRQVLVSAQSFVFHRMSLDLDAATHREAAAGRIAPRGDFDRLTPFLEAVQGWILARRRCRGAGDDEQ